MRFFFFSEWNTNYSCHCVSPWIVPSVPFNYFPASGRLFTSICWYYSIKIWGGSFADLFHPLWTPSSLRVVYQANSSKLDLPISSTQGDCWFPPGFLPPLGNSLRRELLEGGLLCFPSLGDYSPIPAIVQCLKTIVSYISLFFLVLGGRTNLFPITPSRLEALSIHFLKIQHKH